MDNYNIFSKFRYYLDQFKNRLENLPNSVVLTLCLSGFLAGIAADSLFAWPHFVIFAIFLTIICLCSAFWQYLRQHKPTLVAILISLSFIIGLWRIELAVPNFADTEKIYHYDNSAAEFSGVITNIDRYVDGQKITISAKRIGDHNVSGLVLISAPLYPEFQVGRNAAVQCLLKRPGIIVSTSTAGEVTSFDYGKYLAGKNIYATCGFAGIHQDSHNLWLSLSGIIFRIREYLAGRLNATLSEPEVSLLRGIMLGDGRGLPADLSLIFSDLGLSHIVAISGDHIAIIAAALLQVMLLLGLSRPRAFWPIALIIAFYILLVGAPASAVRAGLMALSIMYAQKIGRGAAAGRVLILVAAAMVAASPKILLSDVGFQLSFMAVCGLIYFSPLLNRKLEKLPDSLRLKEILVATISAQITTLPLILYYFGKFSPITIIANLIILPVIPILTIWGLINLLISAVCLPLGQLLGLASWLLIAYWIFVAKAIHGAAIGYYAVAGFDLISLLFAYLLILLMYWRLKD